MPNMIEDVTKFHRVMEIPIVTTPTIPAADRRTLRLKLIAEEIRELVVASEAQDLVEIADAAADIIYVVIGMCLEYGIPLAKVWDEVQRSNMAKAPNGVVSKRPDGKIIKPRDWTPPNITQALYGDT